MSIYAEINGSMQQFGGTCPEGWVSMSEARPDGDYVATSEGLWVKRPANCPYWLEGVEHILVYPAALPEGATLEKPIEISAQEERAMRDKLLSLSDWAVLPDAPLTNAQKQEWQAYRQALRDIPQQSGFPEVVIVPEVPAKV